MAAICDGLDVMRVGHHLAELAHEIPDSFVGGVENMRAVGMHHDAGRRIARRGAVPADVRVPLKNLRAVSCPPELERDGGAGKSGADNGDLHWCSPMVRISACVPRTKPICG